ncbi:MAG: DUF983 domain-containing protein [Flavobacteriales bacterium]|nr:DUF983 domain-containing protein [Flavobacteriales bacterium]
MRKGHKMYSILRWKCPRCHEGDLFISSNAYRVGELSAMPDRCGHCGQKFLLEPGFYYGAMYVSYALTVALSVAVFVAMVVLWEFRPLWYIGINAAIILLLFPWILRTSRAAWINFFVGYEKGAVKRD